MQTVLLAADHAGVELATDIHDYLVENAHRVQYLNHSINADEQQPLSYPDYGYAMAKMMQAEKSHHFGILICGSGVGISMAANRFSHIRAALCTNIDMAMLARKHNDANILVLGARIVSHATAIDCVQIFLNTQFEGGRHQPRVAKLASPPIL
jgi:ribose 5-phosphate isomerase B